MRINLLLANNGSVARDHLASERTFLAYVRTSLVVTSVGVAIVQLFTISSSRPLSSAAMQRYARPLGATAISLSLALMIIGATRFFSIQNALTKGKYPVARIFIAAITTCMVALIAVIFAFVLAEKR
ncbi:uncharacterized protein BT62DRAFT_925049 [Guyanagaster necrorhizus]|uniref:DUF202 domain-containing protein n=1 Tax=Guyanagaster necrorhizus TaxID=856835 RepID=A0A9P7W751_9AGAR|nr:uncharacterized protein BT62DRAFT_925049 [Guyanagaster necrorhizus MCA 3950]KAG7452501.1 hypothetical protein BT62DRAFT_925049 [Guyanagaster necrorhizus MCA 3950]